MSEAYTRRRLSTSLAMLGGYEIRSITNVTSAGKANYILSFLLLIRPGSASPSGKPSGPGGPVGPLPTHFAQQVLYININIQTFLKVNEVIFIPGPVREAFLYLGLKCFAPTSIAEFTLN